MQDRSGDDFINPGSILRVHGQDLLRLDPPETEGGPVRVSAAFYDNEGKLTAKIDENRLVMLPRNWDIQIGGSEVTFRRSPGEIVLRFIFNPRKGMTIDRLQMSYSGIAINLENGVIKAGDSSAQLSTSCVAFKDCRSCIVVDRQGLYFGEALGGRSFRAGSVRESYEMFNFPDGIHVPHGSWLVLKSCVVRGGVRLEGDGRLEMLGGLVIGTNPG